MSILLEKREVSPFKFEVELPRRITTAWLRTVSDADLYFIYRQLRSWLSDDAYGARRSSFDKVLVRQIKRVNDELVRRES